MTSSIPRRFMFGSAVAVSTGLALGTLPLRDSGPAKAEGPSGPHTGHRPNTGGHGGGISGPTFRKGAVVDHVANGFNPTAVLRDFDYGKTST